MGKEQKLVKQFDKDGDGRLNRDERTRRARSSSRRNAPPAAAGAVSGRRRLRRSARPGTIAIAGDVAGRQGRGSELTKDEFASRSPTPGSTSSIRQAGKLTQDEFAERFHDVLPPPPGPDLQPAPVVALAARAVGRQLSAGPIHRPGSLRRRPTPTKTAP
jgi:hypothetical protein